MNCIICKRNSDKSVSKEHIIPESLGNTEHILPKGIVCDSCNNYISRKIEGPLLDDPYFTDIRFKRGIQSKAGQYPIVKGVHLQSLARIGFIRNKEDDSISVAAVYGNDEKKFAESLLKNKKGVIITPAPNKPDEYLMSRFLAKVGLEALAKILLTVEGGLEEVTFKPELDQLRKYIRYGDNGKIWPFHTRLIYPAGHLFGEGENQHEILHEYKIFLTLAGECYLVFILFGIEYAFNLGGPELEGYLQWLEQNQNKSPLYIDEVI